MENKKYKLINSNNHILVNIDNNIYVIDTGSPFSIFYDVDSILIDDKEYKGKNQSINRTDVEKLVGTTVNGVIGLDILSETGITVNFKENIITFDVEEGHLCYFLKKDEHTDWYYTKDCVINNTILDKTIIDSGACISYVNKKHLEPSQKINETYNDYSPIVGNISGNYYEVSIDKVTLGSGNYHHTIKVGEMPNSVEEFTKGADAIVGLYDIVDGEDHHAPNRTVSISFKKNALYIL